MIKFKSIRENVNEALRNPYKGKSERDLKRKLDSFESQLQDLIKKSRGRQRREIEGEIRDMETKIQQVKAALKEDVNEDGHDDVASMKTKVKVAMSALQKMDQELSKLSAGDSLPTWWTNKVAVAVDKLDGMADYLDTKVESVNEAKYDDNDFVHIAKANVKSFYNPKTDKIIGFSKAPKNPNKAPKPKKGANAVMRIGDAKKKKYNFTKPVNRRNFEEGFSNWSVAIPAQTLNGKKIGGGKTPIVVKARSAREAIQKAAKRLGVDFKFLKTGKVTKE